MVLNSISSEKFLDDKEECVEYVSALLKNLLLSRALTIRIDIQNILEESCVRSVIYVSWEDTRMGISSLEPGNI